MKSKRIIATILTLSICLLISVSASNSEDAMKYMLNSKTDTGDVKFSTNMIDANEANTNLQLAFDALYEAKMGGKSPIDVAPEDKYPDYYAGSYINENGELVVILSDGLSGEKEQQAKDEIMELAKSDSIVFGKAKYSYGELSGVMQKLKEFLQGPNAKQAPYKIWAAGTDEYGNKVNIFISSIEPEAIAWFRETISDSGCVNFIKKTTGAEATTAVDPGSKIKTVDSAGFSVGFRARKNSSGVLGFVTAGHSFATAGGIDFGETVTVQNGDGTNIGTSRPENRQFGNMLDAAFIENVSATTVTNTVRDASGNIYTMASGYSIPAQGTIMYMRGQKTGDVVSGTIIETDAVTEYNGVSLFDFYRTSYTTQLGDSGGITFIAYGGGYISAGIQAARDTSISSSYVCKAKNIVSDLGVTPY